MWELGDLRRAIAGRRHDVAQDELTITQLREIPVRLMDFGIAATVVVDEAKTGRHLIMRTVEGDVDVIDPGDIEACRRFHAETAQQLAEILALLAAGRRRRRSSVR